MLDSVWFYVKKKIQKMFNFMQPKPAVSISSVLYHFNLAGVYLLKWDKN